MKPTSIFIASICFGVAGAMTAIIFAPGKQTNTRRKIAKKGHEYNKYLLDNYNDISDSISHPFQYTINKNIRLSQKYIDKANNMKAEVK